MVGRFVLSGGAGQERELSREWESNGRGGWRRRQEFEGRRFGGASLK